MAAVKFFKETALPGVLEANSVYFIAPAASPNYMEVYVTGTSASSVRRILSESDIEAMIAVAVSGMAGLEVVANITARNALTPTSNILVLVLDATGDDSVASGAATYVYQLSTTSWTKISEFESLDLALTWASISGKPSSSVANIDDAVAKKHAHLNKTQLDKVGEDGDGLFTYNGLLPKIAWNSTNW